MSNNPSNPEVYLLRIQVAVRKNKIYYSKHAIMKMDERLITEKEIHEVISTAEIVESYLHDRPFPSLLLMGKTKQGRILHCVVAYDNKFDQAILITTYEPNLDEWKENLKTRRR